MRNLLISMGMMGGAALVWWTSGEPIHRPSSGSQGPQGAVTSALGGSPLGLPRDGESPGLEALPVSARLLKLLQTSPALQSHAQEVAKRIGASSIEDALAKREAEASAYLYLVAASGEGAEAHALRDVASDAQFQAQKKPEDALGVYQRALSQEPRNKKSQALLLAGYEETQKLLHQLKSSSPTTEMEKRIQESKELLSRAYHEALRAGESALTFQFLRSEARYENLSPTHQEQKVVELRKRFPELKDRMGLEGML